MPTLLIVQVIYLRALVIATRLITADGYVGPITSQILSIGKKGIVSQALFNTTTNLVVHTCSQVNLRRISIHELMYR